MRIPIHDLAKNGGKKNFALVADSVTSDDRLCAIDFVQPILVEGQILGMGDSHQVKANLRTAVCIACARCLAPTQVALTLTLDETFVLADQARREDHASSEEQVYTYRSDCIDLTDCVCDNILLDLPLRVLCKPDCKGLCPNCGSDLHAASCGCEKQIDPRLSALKALL